MKNIKKTLEKIFSIKNENFTIYKVKVITIFGKKIKINEELNMNLREYKILKEYCHMRNLKSINKELVASKIENMKESGVLPAKEQRTPKLIVSLTSYPARMYDIHYCLYSLLSQTVKPDKIILWLAEEQFPGKEEDIPKRVTALKDFGLDIKWTKDLKSYKKLVPALKEYPEDIIVTADDDIFYEPEWLEKLYKHYDGKNILCHRAHRILFDENNMMLSYRNWKQRISGVVESFLNFFTGCGGVLYPPNSLHGDILKNELFMKLVPTADDLWFWAMSVLNDSKIKVVENNICIVTYVNVEREANMNGDSTLHSVNYAEGNDRQLAVLFEHYPILLEKLRLDGK